MNYYIIILKIEIHTLYCVQYQFNEVDGVSTNSKHITIQQVILLKIIILIS